MRKCCLLWDRATFRQAHGCSGDQPSSGLAACSLPSLPAQPTATDPLPPVPTAALLVACPPLRFGHGFGRSLLTILSVVAIDFLAVGAGIATAGWAVSNRFLRRKSQHSHAVEQSVEW